jgi:hypothetical protein
VQFLLSELDLCTLFGSVKCALSYTVKREIERVNICLSRYVDEATPKQLTNWKFLQILHFIKRIWHMRANMFSLTTFDQCSLKILQKVELKKLSTMCWSRCAFEMNMVIQSNIHNIFLCKYQSLINQNRETLSSIKWVNFVLLLFLV